MPKQHFKVELISWHQVSRMVDKLAEQIRVSGFTPAGIVAIARGGYVPARLLCDQLNVYDLTAIRITHYLSGARKTPQAQLVEPLHTDISGKNVLLVDDVDDSGDTLELARQHLLERQPAQLKTAVLHHKMASTVVPDYYAHKVVKWRWLTYPWALLEDIEGFLARLEPPAYTAEEAAQRLESQFRIRIPRQILSALFDRR